MHQPTNPLPETSTRLKFHNTMILAQSGHDEDALLNPFGEVCSHLDTSATLDGQSLKQRG